MTPSRIRTASWLWALGAAIAVFAARLHEAGRYTGVVAQNDQWKIEAADLLAPWVDGRLSPAAFFSPHFEHVPVWTRLSAWAQVALAGRWDPFVQTTVNALVYAAFALLVIRWFVRELPRGTALALTLLLVALGGTAHAWENTTWGFQSQFPFALLFLFLHAHGTFAHAPGSRRWWVAQAAGVAALFTLASMWLAPLAVVLAGVWTGARRSLRDAAPLALVALGLGLLAVVKITSPPYGTFAQTSNSPLHFLRALLDLLGWPAGWPGALVVLAAPFAIFALQLRGRRDATSFDLIVLALGLWAVAQAAALAFARGADYGGYVSRYGELLAVFTLANALALVRLASASPRARAAAWSFGALWLAVAGLGLHRLNTGGHAAYFHEHAPANNARRLAAVQAYLERGDRSLLEQPATRAVLYQGVDQIASLLDHPRFRTLLPSEILPANAPTLSGRAVRALQTHAVALGGIGGLLLLVGLAGARTAETRPAAAPFALRADPLAPWLAGSLALASGALVFCWPDPLVFDTAQRWRALLQPPGSVGPLEYRVIGSSKEVPPGRLAGTAPLFPEEARANFAGTDVDGSEFRCTAWSDPFPVKTPWLIVPHAGWPIGNGNGLRLRIETTAGEFVTEVACFGPNPNGIGFWTADVREHQGRRARVVLYDGRSDTEAWVAAAPPIATNDPRAADALVDRQQREKLAHAHTALAVLAIAGLAGCLTGFALPRSRGIVI